MDAREIKDKGKLPYLFVEEESEFAWPCSNCVHRIKPVEVVCTGCRAYYGYPAGEEK